MDHAELHAKLDETIARQQAMTERVDSILSGSSLGADDSIRKLLKVQSEVIKQQVSHLQMMVDIVKVITS